MKKSPIYLSLIGASIVVACGGDPSSQMNEEGMDEQSTEEVVEDVPQKVVYYATPSLVEVASIMKSSGADFSNDLLNDPANSQNYTTNDKRAINLGVYGADLTYSAMFDETQNAINYLNTVKSLSDDLGMDGAFEADLLSKIEQNITDRDALLDIISEFYWSADSYLTDNERPEVAALVICGGWIESMHIACDMAKRSPKNEEIRNRIAEQKLILKNLVLFMEASAPGNENVKASAQGLKDLQAIYKEIEISHSTGNTVTDSEKGETVIGNETTVSMNEANLDALSAKISEIRNSYIEF